MGYDDDMKDYEYDFMFWQNHFELNIKSDEFEKEFWEGIY